MNNQNETALVRDLSVLYSSAGKAVALTWTKIQGCYDYDLGIETPGGNIAVTEKIHSPREGVCTYELPLTSNKIAWAVRVVTTKGYGPWSDFVAEKCYLPTYPQPEPKNIPPTAPKKIEPEVVPKKTVETETEQEEEEVKPQKPQKPPLFKKLWNKLNAETKALLVLILIVSVIASIWYFLPAMGTGISKGYRAIISRCVDKEETSNVKPILARIVPPTSDIVTDDADWILVPPTNYVDGKEIKHVFLNGETMKFRVRPQWLVLTDMSDNQYFVRQDKWVPMLTTNQDYRKTVTFTYKNPQTTNNLEVAISFIHLADVKK